MIYKTLKKVSEYCQLIKNGTFQDGFNGWSSQEISYNIIDGICYCTINAIGSPSIYTFQPTIIKYHKYLMSFDIFPNYSNSANTNGFYLKGNVVWYNIIQKQWNKVEKIVTVTWDTIGALVLYVNNNPNREIGDIANFKNIQLFDLTEMYGAGNEPTTVEEFRQDFPEELYDYKPYCFVKSYKTLLKATDDKIITSYKKSLICTTKNLWTCDKTMSNAIYNSGTQVFKVINTGSESCYTLPTPMPPGTAVTITVYCLSGYTKDVVTIGGYHNETGNTSWQCDCTLPMNIDLSGKSFSHTVITTNTLTDFWIFVYGLVPNNLQFKVQLELGDTATEYHPYGYL